MKISDLKPGQFITKSGKKYEYQGVKTIRGVIATATKLVFQGDKPEDKLLYRPTGSTKTLQDEGMILIQN